MHWAKTRAKVKYDLALSGILNLPFTELGATIADIDINGYNSYGYGPLVEALATHAQVPDESVVTISGGTSMANHLAMAALLEPGDEVLIEHPTYELLISTALYLGANVKRFPRKFETGFRLDPAEIERAVTPQTRMIVLTNLHNPSGAFFDEQTLGSVGEIAKSIGVRVLVDEVYLDAAFHLAPRSGFHLGNEFLTTNSLTKVYGLSGLRCGWILAEPTLAQKMWRLNDLFGVIPAHPAERLSVIALAHLDRIAARAKALLEINRALLNEFLSSRRDLDAAGGELGTISFPRLKQGSVPSLCQLLRKKYETTIVPGTFFEMPEHFRVGIGCNTDMLIGGLERLGAALDELNSS